MLLLMGEQIFGLFFLEKQKETELLPVCKK